MRLLVGERERRRLKQQMGAALALVEPEIAQIDGAVADAAGLALAALLACHAADLEQVDEVGLEGQRQVHVDRLAAVVGQADVLVAGALPQQLGAEDVDRALADHYRAAARDVGVHQLDDQQAVVFLHRRAEVERAHAVDQQLLVGQVARVLVVQPLLAGAEHLHVAETIEHHEGLVVLQRLRALFGARRRRRDIPLVADLDLVCHVRPPAGRVCACGPSAIDKRPHSARPSRGR